MFATGWDQKFRDPSSNPKDKYDQGAPDYQTGECKDAKWMVICAAVNQLIVQDQLVKEEVHLWMVSSLLHHSIHALADPAAAITAP